MGLISNYGRLKINSDRFSLSNPKAVDGPQPPDHLVFRTSKTTKAKLKTFASSMKVKNIPRQAWFWNLYRIHKDFHDVANTPCGYYIPNVANHKYRYIIQIDSDREDIKAKDIKKDKYFTGRGYAVFRIKAFDDVAFSELISRIAEKRTLLTTATPITPQPTRPKTILIKHSRT
jgi:very-short-patch-repair endonuclease